MLSSISSILVLRGTKTGFNKAVEIEPIAWQWCPLSGSSKFNIHCINNWSIYYYTVTFLAFIRQLTIIYYHFHPTVLFQLISISTRSFGLYKIISEILHSVTILWPGKRLQQWVHVKPFYFHICPIVNVLDRYILKKIYIYIINLYWLKLIYYIFNNTL